MAESLCVKVAKQRLFYYQLFSLFQLNWCSVRFTVLARVSKTNAACLLGLTNIQIHTNTKTHTRKCTQRWYWWNGLKCKHRYKTETHTHTHTGIPRSLHWPPLHWQCELKAILKRAARVATHCRATVAGKSTRVYKDINIKLNGLLRRRVSLFLLFVSKNNSNDDVVY